VLFFVGRPISFMEAIDHVLDRACQGESEALSVLYRRFLPGIFGYIAARVPDRTIAEDLTSDVFLAMVENIPRLRARNEAGFTSWLLQIARVTVAGYYRKQEKQPIRLPLEHAEGQEKQLAQALRSPNPADDPAYQVEVREEWHQMVQAMNRLTEEQRQVLVGRLLLGYDVATVARMIGKKANAVKALQFRALNSLHRLLKKQNVAENVYQLPKEEIR
jgi:RNA polymerase sigma-70 factor, ECF subfamily